MHARRADFFHLDPTASRADRATLAYLPFERGDEPMSRGTLSRSNRPSTAADRAIMVAFFPSIIAMAIVAGALRMARRISAARAAKHEALCDSCRRIRDICSEEDGDRRESMRFAPVVYGPPSLN